jgi:rhamnogalacturonan endolyase
LPGTYDVVATIDDPNYQGTATGKLVIATAVLVRHAPVLNGEIEGSVQVLSPEYVILNGGSMISGDLLVPGTPKVVQLGHPIYGGTIDASGNASPNWQTVVLTGNALLRHVVRRVDPIEMPTVEAPPQPLGTRHVSLNHPNQSPGDFATLRDLTLNGNVGPIAIPPGIYGNFVANGASRFVLGVEGATEPTVYNLQSLTLNGGMIEVVSPVMLTVAYGPQLNSSARSTTGSGKLTLRIARGGLTLNGSAQLSAEVIAPNGWVIVNGGAKLEGRVTSDWLIINGRGLLQEPSEE